LKWRRSERKKESAERAAPVPAATNPAAEALSAKTSAAKRFFVTRLT
jgi:hypothetical protein